MFKALKNFFSGKSNPDSVEKAAIASMESQFSHMLQEAVTVETRSVDPDENVATPKGAEISYLDARALEFWDGRRTDYEIPSYYSESAFGRNVGPALKRLLQGGYLERSGVEKNISLKTIPELKAVLAEHELKTSGKKGELICRLRDNLSEYELLELFPTGVYSMTEKGHAAIKPYTILHKNDIYSLGFSYYRLLSERESNPNVSDEDLLVRLLSQDVQKCYVSSDISKFQNVITRSARFLQENGAMQQAMDSYILGFFAFEMQVKDYPQMHTRGQASYLAARIEECGKLEDYTLEQVVERIRTTLEKNRPFGLATRQNINFVISVFKEALSV